MSAISTCGELADFFAGQPRDKPVILSSDEEGNSYSPLADASEAMWRPEPDKAWTGDVSPLREEVEALMAGPNPQGWSEEDFPPDDAVPCIVLYPLN